MVYNSEEVTKTDIFNLCESLDNIDKTLGKSFDRLDIRFEEIFIALNSIEDLMTDWYKNNDK
tara:strand:+ start:253 stop:438 length:186 start_codon:yes stop_codon:yes gene_type:complete